MTKNLFFINFKATSYRLYSYPIRVKLYELKMPLKSMINLLSSKGFIYDYDLLKIIFNGGATNHFNLHYFTHIYNVLGLPMPTPEYLYKSWLRWEEIKAIKLEQRNAGRLKRGLPPVKSLSTREK